MQHDYYALFEDIHLLIRSLSFLALSEKEFWNWRKLSTTDTSKYKCVLHVIIFVLTLSTLCALISPYGCRLTRKWSDPTCRNLL
jgi:hypothetical protein